MNKYASGYTAMGLISVVGWLVIAVSLIGGIIIFSNSNRGDAYIGFIVAIAGAVQGLMLLGVGAIGSAILDGSAAQQDIYALVQQKLHELQESNKINASASSKLANDVRSDIGVTSESAMKMLSFVTSSSLGKPGLLFVETFQDKIILRDVAGKYIVDTETYPSIEVARRAVLAAIYGKNNSVVDGQDIIYNGYRIAFYAQYKCYLMSGVTYAKPEDVMAKIDREFGRESLESYKI